MHISKKCRDVANISARGRRPTLHLQAVSDLVRAGRGEGVAAQRRLHGREAVDEEDRPLGRVEVPRCVRRGLAKLANFC